MPTVPLSESLDLPTIDLKLNYIQHKASKLTIVPSRNNTKAEQEFDGTPSETKITSQTELSYLGGD